MTLAGLKTNYEMPLHTLDLAEELAGGRSRKRRIAVCGVSYLAELADTRNSPTETLVDALLEKGARVSVHDPHVMVWDERPDIEISRDLPSALTDADGVVFAVPHEAYLGLTADDLVAALGRDSFVVDAQDVLTDEKAQALHEAGRARGRRRQRSLARSRVSPQRVSGRRILITGGAGFVGYHLAQQLAEDEADRITLLDDFSRGRRDDELDALAAKRNVDLVTGDVCEPSTWAQLDRGFDEVFHLAAVIGVRNVLERPYDVVRTNTLSTIHLLDWLQDGGGEKVLFSSTSEAYAWTQRFHELPIPTPEDVPLSLDGSRRSPQLICR